MTDKKQIVTDLVPIDICDSTLTKLKHDVEKLIKKYGEGAWITIDIDGEIHIEYNRKETDSEFLYRTKREEIREKERKKFRRKQYEDLKREFEKEENNE